MKNNITFSPSRKVITYCERDIQGDYIIPEGIKKVDNRAFADCIGLTAIGIPGSLRTIGSQAFYYSGLTFLFLPEGVEFIGAGAFCGCFSLSEITLPDSLTVIEEGAFISTGLTGTIIIPDECQIEHGAFSPGIVKVRRSVMRMRNRAIAEAAAVS